MENFFSRVVPAAIVAAVISSIVSWWAAKRTRKQNADFFDRKEIYEFLDLLSEYEFDLEHLHLITEEYHAKEKITQKELDHLFTLHPSVDVIPSTPRCMQRGDAKLPVHCMTILKRINDSRSSFVIAYRDFLFRRGDADEDVALADLLAMVQEIHRSSTAALFELQKCAADLRAKIPAIGDP